MVELTNLRDGLFRLRFSRLPRTPHDAGERRAIKRDIARVLTIMRERELAAKKE